MGSFTKNPVIRNNLTMCEELGITMVDVIIFIDSDHLYIIKNINSMGSDAIMVYIIMYILACTRSGWYPHSMMMIMVGIREASNKM